MRYLECINERSINGKHKFITRHSSCICGCGSKKDWCRLCWEPKEELQLTCRT